jgi:hypothetical protein
MDARRKTSIRLSEDAREGFARVAAKNSFKKPAFGAEEGDENPFSKPSPGTPTKRQIPVDHQFDKKAVKPIVKTLWAMSVALGHALTAHRAFSRLKSSTFSPDGLLGGRGYVLPVKDVRANLFEACEQLSSLCDTLHDEINAPHWKPKIAELEKHDMDEVERLLGDAEDWIDNPDEEADEEAETVEKKPWSNAKKKRFDDEHGFGSKLPSGGDKETLPSQGPHPAAEDHPENRRNKQASLDACYSYGRVANSTLSPQNEPGGPRVQHLDRGDSDQTGPGGSYNQDEQPVQDSWGESGGVSGEPMSQNEGDSYSYPSEWNADLSGKSAGRGNWPEAMHFPLKDAASGVPDSNSESTPTQGYDFGIGDGNGNDAHGQGAGGYGQGNPGSPGNKGDRGVYGPQAELPDDPGGATKDPESDSNPVIEKSISETGHMGLPVNTASKKIVTWVDLVPGFTLNAAGELPNDTDEPVARSDYYAGPKGNDFDVMIHGQAKLPGGNTPQPEAPTKARPSHLYEHEFAATGELPGDESNSVYEYGKDFGPNLGDRVEHGDQPYVKWDDDTHNMRPDYNYQRDPIQGPYPKQDLS